MGNTEGSFTEEEKEIIMGCLLGDAAMRKKTNALLEINHSLKQRELVDFLYVKLKRFVGTIPKERKGKGTRIAYRFTTKSLPCFTNIYNFFFRNRKKIIPKNLRLTGITLAFWFMDDGSKSRKSVYLNTQEFSKKENFLLKEKLANDLGIKVTLNKDKIYFRLRVKQESMEKFKQLTEKYLLPSFTYKLP